MLKPMPRCRQLAFATSFIMFCLVEEHFRASRNQESPVCRQPFKTEIYVAINYNLVFYKSHKSTIIPLNSQPYMLVNKFELSFISVHNSVPTERPFFWLQNTKGFYFGTELSPADQVVQFTRFVPPIDWVAVTVEHNHRRHHKQR